MSQADELLETLTEDDLDPTVEEHIVIGDDRYVTVPEPLQRIAVQYDHNVETVTFDCPRYWDEHDLSTMYIYINFLRQDGFKGIFLTKNLRVDENDSNIIHFEWTIGQDITLVEGPVKFLVCAMETDEDGYERIHWNSEINEQMFVSLGLEVGQEVVERNEAIITDLLNRMDHILLGDGTVIDVTLSESGIAADAATVGERLAETNSRIDSNDTNIETINNRLGDHDTNIETINNRLGDHDTNIETINNNINNINNDITEFKADMDKATYGDMLCYNEAVVEQVTTTHDFTDNLMSNVNFNGSATQYVKNGTINILNKTIDFAFHHDYNSSSDGFNNMKDGSTSTFYGSKYMFFQFNKAIKINKISVNIVEADDTSNPKTIYLRASNDGTKWTRLATITTTQQKQSTSVAITLSNTGYYTYYEFNCSDDRSSGYIRMHELKITDYQIQDYSNTITVNNETFTLNNIDNIPNYKILLIKVPDYPNDISWVQSNTINGLTIDSILEPNSFYNLIWDHDTKKLIPFQTISLLT